MEETEENTKKQGEIYSLEQVPTQMGLAIKTPEGKYISSEQGIVECLNLLKDIKKATV